MKILYHHRTRSKDGQCVHIEEMIAALRDLGHEVIIVAPPSTAAAAFGSDAGVVAWMKRYIPKFIYEIMELGYALLAYRQLSRAVRAHHPDCLYERYNLFQPAGVWLKRNYKLPMLLEVNSPIFEERLRSDGIALKWLAQWSQHYTWRGADYVLPVTRALAALLAEAGVPQQRIVSIPNAINPDSFTAVLATDAAKQRLNLQGRLVLGFTGFLRDWHGLDKVIELMSHDPSGSKRHLLVVGDGPARPALEQQAKSLGIAQRITFTGIVPRAQLAQYVAAFDIALQPAVVAYASPLKLFEYLALGKAIVAPAQSNMLEILADGVNAVLFDTQNAGAMAAAIDRLCNDPAMRARIGESARATIAEKQLTWNANALKVCHLFDTLAAGHA